MTQPRSLNELYLSLLTHDGMTALANIQFCTEMLADDESLIPMQQKFLQSIFASQKRLTFSMQNVLDAEKIHAGYPLPYQPVSSDIATIVADVCDLLRDEARSRNVRLHVLETSPTSFICSIDPVRMERLLWNILFFFCGNTAVDHTVTIDFGEYDGGKGLYIEICVTELKSEQVVSAVEKQMAFLPQTSNDIEQYSNRALGLFVSAQMVNQRSGHAETMGGIKNFQMRFSIPNEQDYNASD